MKKHGITREAHIAHEKNKFSQGKWENTINRKDQRIHDSKIIKDNFEENIKKVLCIGARHESEIEDLQLNFDYVVGIDIVDAPGIKRVDAHDLCNYFPENSFDIVYASHSLEHMVEPEKVLLNIRKVAKLGCFISLPIFSKTYNSHCSLFDICQFLDENKESILDESFVTDSVFKNQTLLKDFDSLGNIEITYFRISSNLKEFSMLFKWL